MSVFLLKQIGLQLDIKLTVDSVAQGIACEKGRTSSGVALADSAAFSYVACKLTINTTVGSDDETSVG